jgi:hypothetical protein
MAAAGDGLGEGPRPPDQGDDGGFREYHDPFTAQGYGSDDFSRTAALLLDVLDTQAAESPA